MKKLVSVFLITGVTITLLAGCVKKEDTPPSSEVVTVIEVAAENDAVVTTPESVVKEITEETKEGFVRSQLTNEWIAESLGNNRPLAIMMPNDKSALPQYNISQADILYQCQVEGEITRLMALYDDWQNMERLGNIRSARHYYVYWAFEWDAIFCHYGNPCYANPVLNSPVIDNINGMSSSAGVFFRSSDRRAPQNAYLTTKGILKACKENNFSLTHTSYFTKGHFNFHSETNPVDLSSTSGSTGCTLVDLSSAYPIDKAYFEYNSNEQLYYRFQYGAPHMDGATKTQLAFKNVIIQNTQYKPLDKKGYLDFSYLKGGDGYFITNGKAIPITWSKKDDYSPTRYFALDGTEISLNTGKTMVCIVEQGDSIALH